VQRKRRAKKYGTSKERSSRRDVSAAVDSVIVEAEKSLTTAQKEIIALRQKKVNLNPPEESVPREEGHSGSKGKGIDPRNWGNVQLSEGEADVEAQQAALDSFHSQKKPMERDLPPHQSVAPSEPEQRENSVVQSSRRTSKTPVVNVPKNTRPPESRPQAQIAPKSFLGIALQKVGKKFRRKHSENPSDPSSSESSDESSSSDSGSDNSEPDSHSKKKSRKKRSKKHRRRRRSSSRHSRGALKVFKPKHYNGDADARAYHRFVKESNAYIEDNKIKSKRRAFALSYFLDGKAYDFYVQKVSRNEEDWSLEEFYTELFNFCFP